MYVCVCVRVCMHDRLHVCICTLCMYTEFWVNWTTLFILVNYLFIDYQVINYTNC